MSFNIKQFFGLCEHKWKIIQKYDVYLDWDDKPAYVKFAMQCEKCGKIKKKIV